MDCESWLGSKHTATVQTFCGQRVGVAGKEYNLSHISQIVVASSHSLGYECLTAKDAAAHPCVSSDIAFLWHHALTVCEFFGILLVQRRLSLCYFTKVTLMQNDAVGKYSFPCWLHQRLAVRKTGLQTFPSQCQNNESTFQERGMLYSCSTE